MKIYVCASPEVFFELEWPDGWRIPARGESLMITSDVYRVDDVQREFEQGDAEPAIQLRVSGGADT